MRYLICENCGGYYELKPGESIDDFDSCQCGGKFRYIDHLDELNHKNNETNKTISIPYKSLKDQSNTISKSNEPNINKYCSNCGSENKQNSIFCKNCGMQLKQSGIVYGNSITARIDWKKAFTGAIIGIILTIILFLGYIAVFDAINAKTFDFSYAIMMAISSGFYTSFIISGDLKKHVINGITSGIIAITMVIILIQVISQFTGNYAFYTNIFLSYIMVQIFLGALIGGIGGFLGEKASSLNKKKYSKIIGILLVIFIVGSILTINYGVQFAVNSQPKYFDNSYVSFSYPGFWEELETDMPELGYTQVANVFNNDKTIGVYAYKYYLPFGLTFQRFQYLFYADFLDNRTNAKIISKRNITLNGVPAYEVVKEQTIDGIPIKSKDLWFDQNIELYSLTLIAPSNKFDQEQNDFNLILNSFKIK